MKQTLLTILLIFLPLLANADVVEIDGICYNLIPKGKVAEVTSNPNKYTGEVIIPTTVVYERIEYSVTSIGKSAFRFCSDLTSVTIPNSVECIGWSAFSGWSEIPSTMPPYDVTVTGTFNINSYKLTYMIDDKVYKEMMYEYGATIIPESQPEGDYQTFEWTDLPQTMPAHDVVVHASYTSGIIEVLMTSRQNVRIYSPNGKKLNKLQKGLNIVIFDDGTVKKIIMK